MTIRISKCIDCKFIEKDLVDGKSSCKAFPNGIPQEIFWKHYGYKCSDSITFEPTKEAEPMYKNNIFVKPTLDKFGNPTIE